MSFLEITSVSKSFNTVHVLENINLDIESGEFVVFVGPSGCGKSTLLRMITGLETPTGGEIKIEGQIMNDVEPADRGTAMVFQSYALYPHMSVFGNVSFGLRMARRAKDYIQGKVESAATILKLQNLLERKPGQLSGGQKQRVAIGRAIVREPRVFLFDEPLSNLDAELRVQMRTELMDLHRRLGATMIYVTHDQVEAMTLADKMVVMNAGRVQQVGRPLELYDDPDNSFVAGFVGSPRINLIAAKAEAISPGSIRLTIGKGVAAADMAFAGFGATPRDIELGLRPHHLRIVRPSETLNHGLVLEGDVAFVEQLGDVSYVHTDLADGTRIIVRADRQTYTGETHVRLVADLQAAMLFGEGGGRIREQGVSLQ